MIVLGIETSCDDTSLALYSRERGVIANVTASQLIHDEFGGVVPEIASRQHIRAITPTYHGLLRRSGIEPSDIDGVGVTNGPGLIGSLLVGVSFAKSLAWVMGKPLVGVHHIEAHILSNELDGQAMRFPCVVLVVSGGHTCLFHAAGVGSYELSGRTRDDAAGEAFDKIAKVLGLGFPGGPVVQKAAATGNTAAIDFPRALRERDNFDFSFSGLKTAVRLHVEATPFLTDPVVSDIAASAQKAIVEVLIDKTVACARYHGVGDVYIAGGVAANASLRDGMRSACEAWGLGFHAPLLDYCTDNGAMIARAAEVRLAQGHDDGLSLDVFARRALA